MNGAKYREILDENLLQSTQNLRLGQRFTFQQDNAGVNWDKSLNVLECPSQSPDLNPIEHLWRDLKIAVHQTPRPTSQSLRGSAEKKWEKLHIYR